MHSAAKHSGVAGRPGAGAGGDGPGPQGAGSDPRAVGPDVTRPGACARRVVAEPAGPVLIEGPVEVVRPDGSIARSDRFVVAVCTCRRTGTPPWCDTSHRGRRRPRHTPRDAPGGGDVAGRDPLPHEEGQADDRD